jgi:hypothetical protein
VSATSRRAPCAFKKIIGFVFYPVDEAAYRRICQQGFRGIESAGQLGFRKQCVNLTMANTMHRHGDFAAFHFWYKVMRIPLRRWDDSFAQRASFGSIVVVPARRFNQCAIHGGVVALSKFWSTCRPGERAHISGIVCIFCCCHDRLT